MNELSLFYMRHHRSKTALPIRPSRIAYYDLTILLKGTLHYRLDGAEVVLHEGDAVLIGKGTLRERQEGAEKTEYISFNFHGEPVALPTLMPAVAGHTVQLIVAACDEVAKGGIHGNEQRLEHLLAAILLSLQHKLERKNVSPLTAKIIDHITRHLSERITLADIGALTFFSPVYCDTVFKRDTGRSIIDYLLEERVAMARKLLAEGTLSLKEIAEVSGFGDGNYFSRIFKKRTGYTPLRYRKLALHGSSVP